MVFSDDMFRLLMEELRAIRHRLDEHIKDESQSFDQLRKEISTARQELSSQRARLSSLSAGIALVVTAFVSWLMSTFNR